LELLEDYPDKTPSHLGLDVDHDLDKSHLLGGGYIQLEAWIIQKQALM